MFLSFIQISFILYFIDLRGLIENKESEKLLAILRHEPYLMDLEDGKYTLPLMSAKENDTLAMEIFIAAEFDPQTMVDNKTVFHEAAENGSLDVLKMLINYKPEAVNIKSNRFKQTPLHYACICNQPKIVDYLVQIIDDPNIKDRYGRTALNIATQENHTEIVRILLRHGGIDVNARNVLQRCNSPLIDACRNNYYEIAELLLAKKDIDPNIADTFSKQTPLEIACINNDIKMVSLLTKHKSIDLNIKNSEGRRVENRTTDQNIKKLISKLRLQKI